MDKIRELVEKIKDGWNGLDKNKKTAIIVIIVGILLFASIYTIISKKVNYVALYKDLSLEDAGAIVEDLESKQIKYKLEDGGTTILIDSDKIDKYRLELATEGNLPSDTMGFEIFDDMDMMVTDDDRKIMYQRALEGELEKSISSLDAITKSKVHLVMSEKSIFETEEREASASVIIAIKPNAKLSEESLMGIASLVSGAVENLPLSNIQIVDSEGNLLSAELEGLEDENAVGLVNKHQQVRSEFEKELEDNILRILSPVLGTHKVRVVVNADLDFDSTETETIKYSDPLPRSEDLNVNGRDLEIQDDDGNIGYNASNVIDEVDGEDASYSRTTNNELTTEKSNTITAPGKINKLTASVVYDGVLSDDNLEEIENLVGTAIGYDLDRDDLINVTGMEFDPDEKDRLEGQLDDFNEEDKVRDFIKDNKFIIIGFFVLLTLVILIFVLRRIFKKDEEEDFDFEEFERTMASAPDRESDSDDNDEVEKDKIKKDIEKNIDVSEETVKEYTEKHPDLAADLIKVWMKDDE